jgi:putative nucleotidyltransferase with HDIG domain
LLVLLNEDDGHASQIVELIAFDPALTAKVLQRCNSAAFGLAGSVSNLDEAVTQVGFNAIYRLVAMVSAKSLLGAGQAGYGIGSGELWEHSVTTAVAARVMARKLGGDENLAFTAALLHDIGKLVLGAFLEDCRQSVLRKQGRRAIRSSKPRRRFWAWITRKSADGCWRNGISRRIWSAPSGIITTRPKPGRMSNWPRMFIWETSSPIVLDRPRGMNLSPCTDAGRGAANPGNQPEGNGHLVMETDSASETMRRTCPDKHHEHQAHSSVGGG